MPLSAGTRLGPYEVLSALGAGGMGEVYKARDTRLDRLVAVKILPAALAADPQFRERFDREARAISQLTHPHICTLYDVGEHDGTAFLIMELLDGETLADRLKKGALPLDEALKVAIQIADALSAAHRQGIVHRDLKPGNVVLTKAGAKLLDFGLAKASGPAITGAGLSMLPTTPPNLTAQGTILGTFQYMAPEQLEGHEADARTDIFAFGCVLYEMLTGKRAFEGKSQASLISAILKDEPPAVSHVQLVAPAALDRIVAKCLAKDPESRWQTARDLHDELQWMAGAGAGFTGATSVASRSGRERLAWMLFGTAALAFVVIAGLALLLLRSLHTEPPPEMRLDVVAPAPTIDRGWPALSPDGRYVVYVSPSGEGQQQLWVRALDSTTPQALAGVFDATLPFWSPDSQSIAFFAGGMLKRIDLAGGIPQNLTTLPAPPLGGAWNADDVIVFACAANPLLRVSATGGEVRAVTKLDPPRESSHGFPSFLPDGHHLLYVATGTSAGVYFAALDGSNPRRVVPNAVRSIYALPGYLLFERAGSIFVQRFTTDGELIDRSVPFAQQAGGVSVSRTGLVAYRGALAPTQGQLVWFDRGGKQLATIGASFEGLGAPELSPDGKQVVLSRRVDGNDDIYVVNIVDGAMTRLTVDAGVDTYPLWSPDGRRIVFSSNRTGKVQLFEKPSSGAEPERPLLDMAVAAASSWSPDGRNLLYRVTRDFWMVPMVDGGQPSAWLTTAFDKANAQFSPDGQWVAYTSVESGRYEIFVKPFRGPGRWTVSTGGGIEPRWRSDGKELFYLGSDTGLRAVAMTVSPDGRSLSVGTPTLLFRTDAYGGFTSNARIQYVVADNGQRFLVNRSVRGLTTPPITIVTNWTAGLKK
jgi:Tol biopolymer transport system component